MSRCTQGRRGAAFMSLWRGQALGLAGTLPVRQRRPAMMHCTPPPSPLLPPLSTPTPPTPTPPTHPLNPTPATRDPLCCRPSQHLSVVRLGLPAPLRPPTPTPTPRPPVSTSPLHPLVPLAPSLRCPPAPRPPAPPPAGRSSWARPRPTPRAAGRTRGTQRSPVCGVACWWVRVGVLGVHVAPGRKCPPPPPRTHMQEEGGRGRGPTAGAAIFSDRLYHPPDSWLAFGVSGSLKRRGLARLPTNLHPTPRPQFIHTVRALPPPFFTGRPAPPRHPPRPLLHQTCRTGKPCAVCPAPAAARQHTGWGRRAGRHKAAVKHVHMHATTTGGPRGRSSGRGPVGKHAGRQRLPGGRGLGWLCCPVALRMWPACCALQGIAIPGRTARHMHTPRTLLPPPPPWPRLLVLRELGLERRLQRPRHLGARAGHNLRGAMPGPGRAGAGGPPSCSDCVGPAPVPLYTHYCYTNGLHLVHVCAHVAVGRHDCSDRHATV